MTTPREDNRGLGRASMLLASGTVVSRVLGFISAIILARTLGTVGAGADTFALANQLPNNIYAIVAGGVLSAVLVPHIVKAGLDKDGGQSFINKIVTLGFLIFLAVAVLATLLAPALVALYAQSGGDGGRGFSPEEIALAVAFAYWCLPQILFYALYSLLSEVLNALWPHIPGRRHSERNGLDPLHGRRPRWLRHRGGRRSSLHPFSVLAQSRFKLPRRLPLAGSGTGEHR